MLDKNGISFRGRRLVFVLFSLSIFGVFRNNRSLLEIDQHSSQSSHFQSPELSSNNKTTLLALNDPPPDAVFHRQVQEEIQEQTMGGGDTGEFDEIIWKFDIKPAGGYRSLPVFTLCKWYEDGDHPRSSSRSNGTTIFESGPQVQRPFKPAPKPIHLPPLPPSGKVRMVLQLPCEDIFKRHDCGTGNWVQHHYMLRMAAMHAAAAAAAKSAENTQISLDITCTDMENPEVPKTLVLPWLTGNFSGSHDLRTVQEYWNSSNAEVKTICPTSGNGWYDAPLLYLLPLMRDELRTMAVELIGPPSDDMDHPAHKFLLSKAQQDDKPFQPLLPDVEIDQAVIHFRCGDIMANQKWPMFHFLKFKAYADRIPLNTTKSIGIVTQPFKNTKDAQTRARDEKNQFSSSLCEEITYSFEEYLQKRFPYTRVSIRNGPEETVALASARMVMARHSFAAPDSTFSIFPTLATFGIGYHNKPIEGGLNQGLAKYGWLVDDDPNVVLMDPGRVLPVLRTSLMKKENRTLAKQAIAKWFREDDFHILKNKKYFS